MFQFNRLVGVANISRTHISSGSCQATTTTHELQQLGLGARICAGYKSEVNRYKNNFHSIKLFYIGLILTCPYTNKSLGDPPCFANEDYSVIQFSGSSTTTSKSYGCSGTQISESTVTLNCDPLLGLFGTGWSIKAPMGYANYYVRTDSGGCRWAGNGYTSGSLQFQFTLQINFPVKFCITTPCQSINSWGASGFNYTILRHNSSIPIESLPILQPNEIGRSYILDSGLYDFAVDAKLLLWGGVGGLYLF